MTKWNTHSFINTKKAIKKLHVLFWDVSRLFLIHLQSKNKATLGNASNSKPKDSVMQKTSKAKPKPPTLSNFLKAGPTETFIVVFVY